MSDIFKTKAVVLKKEKLPKWDFLYTFFSYEYWKILCSKRASNKEKEVEIWACISCEVSVKKQREIHNLRNIKIKSQINYTKLNFETINSYLFLVSQIYKNCQKGMIIPEIYDVLEIINSKENIENYSIILWRLKIKNILWNLNDENENQTVKKIIHFIINNNFRDIIRLTWIEKDIEKRLEQLLS